MSAIEYRQDATAVLLVDPYNDFLSEGGLLWPRLKEVAEEVGLLDNLRAIQAAARAGGTRIFIVPHRQVGRGRLRELAARQSHSAEHHEAPFVREGNVGRRAPCRFRAPAR